MKIRIPRRTALLLLLGLLLLEWGAATPVLAQRLGPARAGAALFPTPRFPTNKTSCLLTADLDGDGDLDVATSHGGVTVHRNDGRGRLGPGMAFGLGGAGLWHYDIEASDVDGDGDLDLVFAEMEEGNVTVVRNDGQAAFGPPSRTYSGAGTLFVEVGDLDGDGDPDLATTNAGGFQVSVMTNDGAGNFRLLKRYPGAARPWSLALADLDGDLDLDIAVTDRDGGIAFFFNNGDATFGPAVYDPVAPYVDGIVDADLDGDGDTDLVVNAADGTLYSVLVLLNDGTGSFVPTEVSSLRGIHVVEDLNGDRILDLGIVQAISGPSRSLWVYPGRGDGSFGTPVPHAFPNGLPATGDLDGDGTIDVVASRASIPEPSLAVLFNDRGRLEVAVPLAVGFAPSVARAGDVDGDGRLDLVGADRLNDTVSVFLGRGRGFAPRATYAAENMPRSLALSDLDGDGDLDVATVNADETASVLSNRGDGTFALPVTYLVGPGGPAEREIVARDLDADGSPDLVVSNGPADSISVLRNAGDGTFGSADEYGTGAGPWDIAAGDVDGDGDADLAVAAFLGGSLSVLENLGDGTFAGEVSYPAQALVRGVDLGDVDADGDLDAVTEGSLFLNLGDGTFAARIPLTTGSYVGLLDVDRDGALDLVGVDRKEHRVLVRLGHDDGSFGAPIAFHAVEEPSAIGWGDWDANGHPDLALSIPASGAISVLFHRARPRLSLSAGPVDR